MAEDLSVESVLKFVASHGGKVKNAVLVPHFKKFFNNPATKNQDRHKFKEIINTVATVKVENGEKYVILKKKYRSESNSSTTKSEEEISSAASTTTLTAVTDEQQQSAEGAVELVDGGGGEEAKSSSGELPEPSPHQQESEKTESKNDNEEGVFVKPLPPKTVVRPAADVVNNENAKGGIEGAKRHTAAVVVAPSTLDAGNRSGSLSRRAKKESPNMNERHSAVTGRFSKSAQAAAASSGGGGTPTSGERRSRPLSIYQQGTVPGAFERVRQNFVAKPKHALDDATNTTSPSSGGGMKNNDSLTNSQASLGSKDQEEDYDRNSPQYVLDANDKQWILSACRGDLIEMRKLLDDDDTLADKKDFIMGYTALHWAAKKGNKDMAQILIEANVQLSPKSNGGYTPLHLAAMNGHEDVVTLLLESGADANVRDFSGRQPIHYLKSIALPLQSKRSNHHHQHQQHQQQVNCSNAPKWKLHAFSGTPHARARSDKLHLKLTEHTRAFASDHRLTASSLAFVAGGQQGGRRRRGSFGNPDQRARGSSFSAPQPVESSNVKIGPDIPTGHKVSRAESMFRGFIRRNSARGGKSSRNFPPPSSPRPVDSSPQVSRHRAGTFAAPSDSKQPVPSPRAGKSSEKRSAANDAAPKFKPIAEAASANPQHDRRANVIKAAPAARFMWKPTSK